MMISTISSREMPTFSAPAMCERSSSGWPSAARRATVIMERSRTGSPGRDQMSPNALCCTWSK